MPAAKKEKIVLEEGKRWNIEERKEISEKKGRLTFEGDP